MAKFIRNTSILTVLLVGFLFSTQLNAQEVNEDSPVDDLALPAALQSANRRIDEDDAEALSHQEDDDEGRRPRGFLAALFGYPDEFEGSDPAASQPKAVSVEAPAMFRGSANARGLGQKKLSSMFKAVSVSAPKLSTTFKNAMSKKTTTTEAPSSESEELVTAASTKVTTSDSEDATLENASAASEVNATTVDDVVLEKSGNGTGNATEGASGQKREARPTGGNRGPRGPLPFNGPGHPLPAGYILWHPVPAPFFGGPDVPEHPLASQNSPVVLPSRGAPRGPPDGPGSFLPHRPLFVEPFSGPFSHPGPFPITQFSSPPVFAVSPDEAKSGRGGKGKGRTNKKPGKGGKSKHRPKGRPNDDDDEAEIQDGGDEGFPERGLPRPVHVLLPPIPPHGFQGGPNFGNFGPPNQQQQFGNEGGPFRGGPAFGNNQQNLDQQRAPQNVNGDFRGPPNGNFNNNNNNNNNNNGFRGPPNGNGNNNNNFRGNEFNGPSPGGFQGPTNDFGGPNNNFGGPNNNFGGPSNNFGGPNNNFGGPSNSFGGPNNNFGGPSSNFGGPNNNFGGPSNNFGGPNNNFGGPNNNFGGPGGNFNGPLDETRSEKPRRPSPSPSAHPAKFEIDHQKKMQAEFEEAQSSKQRAQDVPPPPPFIPPIVPPPIPSPANFPLPNFPQDPFRFASTLPPFSFSSPPPQFLDAPPGLGQPFPGGPDFLPHPLPSPPSHSSHAAFPTASPPPRPNFSAPPPSVPALSLSPPPAAPGRFADAQLGARDHFPTSTPQALTDETSSEEALIYTRDFKKQVGDLKPTSESPFPVFSPAQRQPQAPGGQTQHFGQQQRVQRFPAVQQGQSSFPRLPANPFNDRTTLQQNNQGGDSSQNFRDEQRNGFRDNSQNNFGANSPNNFRENSPNNFRENSPNNFRENSQNSFQDSSRNNFRDNGQGRRKTSSNRNRANRPNKLPETHPNLPDLKTELNPTERHTESTTLQPDILPIHESSTAASFSVARDNYASPGFHTGHKGYPSSVTLPSLEGQGLSTTLAPRSRPTSKSQERSQSTKNNGQNHYGSTFRTSFTSSPAGGSKSGLGTVDYHYEIQYQSPVPAVATFTTAKPLRSGGSSRSLKKNDAQTSQSPAPFGVEGTPEYTSSVYQSAQDQSGSYKPGTSRILLEMGKWNEGQEDSLAAQEAHPYLQSSQ